MRLQRTGKAMGVIALAGAVALGAAACDNNDSAGTGDGADGGNADPKAAIMASFEDMQGKTYTMDMSMGDMGSGSFEVDVPNKAQHANIDIDTSAIDPSAGMGEMSMEMITINTDMWMKMGGDAGAGIPGMDGDKWMHTTTDDLGAGAGMEAMDMQSMTQQMMDSLDNVKETGDNTYTATMDLGSLAETFSGGAGTDTAAPEIEPFDVTLTLNDDDLLQSMEFTIPSMEEGMPEIPMSMEITGYDVDVNVEAPPADEVTEMGDF